MTACTPRPRTAAPGFRCRSCSGSLRQGRIGQVAPRFFGAPTNRSHRVTIETDAPEILARCRADKVDAAVLVPNCPVCHQTVSLVARHLEANGIPTVVMGCAKDIVEHAAVPRFLFSRFPARQFRRQAARSGFAGLHAGAGAARAGNRAGPADHRAVAAALERGSFLEARLQQCRHVSADELARLRREFDAQKEIAKGIRESAA